MDGLRFGVSLVALAAAAATPATGQVVTDGSLPAHGGEASVLGAAGLIEIPQALGETRGTNLFHSFQQFDVPEAATARFSGSAELANIFARVTGDTASQIDGALESTAPLADLWLINPNGVFFGPTAVVNVPAGLHVTTADEIQFADGTVFSAAELGVSTISAAEPEAFGFLQPNPADIVINGATITSNAPDLRLTEFVGGDVTVDNAAISTLNGDVQIISLGGAADATRADRRLTFAEDVEFGEVTIRNSEVIGDDAIVVIGRNVAVEGSFLNLFQLNLDTPDGALEDGLFIGAFSDEVGQGTLTIQNSDVVSETIGETTQPIAIETNGAVAIVSSSIRSDASTLSDANAGGVTILSLDSIEVVENSQLASGTIGAIGDAGAVLLDAPRILIRDSGLYSETVNGGGSGAIVIGYLGLTDTVTLENARLDARFDNGVGVAGAVSIAAQGAVTVAAGSNISVTAPSEAFLGDMANAGQLQIVGGSIAVSGGSVLEASANTAIGAGVIRLYSESTLDLDSANISNATQTGPFGGIIDLSAGTDVTIRASEITNEVTNVDPQLGAAYIPQDFATGNVLIQAGRNVAIDQSILGTNGASGGSAGEVNVFALNTLSLTNGTVIDTSVSGIGFGGAASLLAGDVVIRDSTVSAQALDAVAGAPASDQRLTQISIIAAADPDDTTASAPTGSVTLQNATVRADTFGYAAAPIAVLSTGDTLVDASQLTSEAAYGAVGDAGQIAFTAGGLLTFQNGSYAASSSYGNGAAGRIIGTGSNVVVSDTGLYSNSRYAGSAGVIRLGQAGGGTDSVTVTDGSDLTVNFQYGYGTTGGIYIEALNAITIDGESALRATAIESFPNGAVDQPVIALNANDVAVRDTELEASAQTLRGSGILVLDGANALTVENTSVLNSTSGGPLGGSISLNSTGDVVVRNSYLNNIVQDVVVDPIVYAPRDSVDGSIFVEGRNVTIDGGSFQVIGFGGGSAGLIAVESPDLISVTNGAILDASVAGIGYGGSVRLRGGDIEVADTFVGAQSIGANSGGSASDARTTEISFIATADGGDEGSAPSNGDIRIESSGVSSDTEGLEGAGIVLQNDGDLVISNSAITSDAFPGASENGGNIIAFTDGRISITNSALRSGTQAPLANAGTIQIFGGVMDVVDSLFDTQSLSGGDAGFIQLGSNELTQTLRVSGSILDTQFDGGVGEPGSIGLSAGEEIRIENGSTLTLRVNELFATDADDFTELTIFAPVVSVTGGTRIESTAESIIGAGTIDVVTTQSLQLDDVEILNETGIGGDGGRVLLFSQGDIALSNVRVANDVTGGETFLQRIVVEADDQARAEIVSQLRSLDSFNLLGVLSDAGSIEITDSNLSTSGSLLSDSGSIGVVSEAGDVTITRTNLSAETFGAGDGGAIIVSSTDETRLIDTTLSSSAAVSDFQGPRGAAGGALIRGRVVDISGVRDRAALNGAVLVTGAARRPGARAGNILITADERIDITNGANIRAETAVAEAGRIEISAQDRILLADSDVTTSVAGGAGDGGDVLVGAPAMFRPVVNPDGSLSVVFQVQDGARLPVLFLLESDVTADAQRGAGGNIVFPIAGFVQSANSVVSASSAEGGREGTVTSSQPEADIASALAPLDTGLTETAELVADACAGGSSASSLTAAGRGAEPEAPDRALYVRTIDRPRTEVSKKRPPIAVVCATARAKRG